MNAKEPAMTRFDTRESLTNLGDALTLLVMTGLTAATLIGTTAYAAAPAAPHSLTKAEMLSKAEPVRLPLVVITAKRVKA
jgi:hypothetical protein